MPILLAGLDRLAPQATRIAVSPLVELGAALHALHDPGHHNRSGWAEELRIPASLRTDLDAWSFTFRAVRALPFITTHGDGVSTWSADRRRLDLLPPADLAVALARPLHARGGPRVGGSTPEQAWRDAERWASARGTAVRTLVERLRNQPDRAVGDFLELLDRCWAEFFAAEWRRVRPLLAQRATHDRDLLQRHDLYAVLQSVSPAVQVDRRRHTARIEKVHSKRLEPAARGLALIPSEFTEPHLYVADDPGLPVTLMYGRVRDTDRVPALSELISALEALAHPVRLQICRAVASEARSAGEIASWWRLEPTQVTKHLRALTRAGLVRSTRTGRFVEYALDDTAVRRLGTDVAGLLQR